MYSTYLFIFQLYIFFPLPMFGHNVIDLKIYIISESLHVFINEVRNDFEHGYKMIILGRKLQRYEMVKLRKDLLPSI